MDAALDLPDGFVIDQNNDVPDGFVVDKMPDGFVIDQPSQPSSMDAIAHLSGVAARGVYKGIAGIADTPEMIMNAGKWVENNLPSMSGTRDQIPYTPLYASDMMDKYLNAINVPTPQTKGQETLQRIGQGIGGGAIAGPIGAISGASGGASSGVANQLGIGPLGQAVAGVIGGAIPLGLNSIISSKPYIQPTADEVRSNASGLYKEAAQAGGALKPEVTNKFLDELKSVLPQSAKEQSIVGENAASDIINNLTGEKSVWRDTPLTLQEAQGVDVALGNRIDAAFGANDKALVKQLSDIQDKFRDSISNVPQENMVGGSQGWDAWNKAKFEWAKQASLRDLEKIVTRAEGTQQPANTIRSGFNALYNNEKRMRGFSDVERAAIKRVSETGVIHDLLNMGASRLWSFVGGSVGGVPGALLAHTGSSLSREGAEAYRLKQVGDVYKLINNRTLSDIIPK